MLRIPLLILVSTFTMLLGSCAFRSIKRSKHIVYREESKQFPAQELNVFAPVKHHEAAPVLLFIHGGNWRSGKKELYSWFGSRLARKGIVAVVVDYPLSPEADYTEQARYSALALRWTWNNIASYGGDPERIFLSGHSSGGHLAALLGTDSTWLRTVGLTISPRGLVLIDAAGLNMYGYLRDGGLKDEATYPATFGTDAEGWKKATPLHHIHNDMPPMLILTGGRSYPSIISSNDTFARAMRERGFAFRHIVQPRRRHVPMITQFFNTFNPRYRDLSRFLNSGTP